jgi:hypothetical protein
MNKSKISLADVLTVVGAIGFGYCCFLSLNFLSMGNTMPSIIVAVVFALFLGGLAFGVKLLKKTSKNFKICRIWEWILLAFFAVVALVAIIPFSHYFSVSQQKKEIQQTVIANIVQGESLFMDYETYANNRLLFYENKLQSIVSAKDVNPSEFEACGFVPDINDSTQVENKMFILRAQLYPSNYEGMKQNANIWLMNAKNTAQNWNMGIINVMNDIENNLTQWASDLKSFALFRAECETAEGETIADFEFPLTFGNAIDKMTQMGTPTLLSIILAIGLYGIMLLSYFVSKRNSRSIGSLSTAPYEIVL